MTNITIEQKEKAKVRFEDLIIGNWFRTSNDDLLIKTQEGAFRNDSGACEINAVNISRSGKYETMIYGDLVEHVEYIEIIEGMRND